LPGFARGLPDRDGQPRWIWHPLDDPLRPVPEKGERFFRAEIPSVGYQEAYLDVYADAVFTVSLDGREVGKGGPGLHTFNVTQHLKVPGRRRLTIQSSGPTARPGLLAQLLGRIGVNRRYHVTGYNWQAATAPPKDWLALDQQPMGKQPYVRVLPLDQRVTASGNLCDATPLTTPITCWVAAQGFASPGGASPVVPQVAAALGVVAPDASTLPRSLPLKVQVADFRFDLSRDPNDGEGFLRYPRDHRLATAGPNKGPVGVPPRE
jgi:hypothetical protein